MSNNVYQKLQKARMSFLSEPVKKSGKNKFAGYEYFELGDFIPTIHRLFDESGLIGIVNFSKEDAILTVYNAEKPDESIQFTSPLVYASNPKGQPIQDLGSTHTYMRRYLWLMAMEIVEHDAVDSAPQEDPKPSKKASKPPEKASMTKEDQDLLVEKLIEHGHTCNNQQELTGLWKANQSQIDEIKATNEDGFEKLKAAFAEIKFSLVE